MRSRFKPQSALLALGAAAILAAFVTGSAVAADEWKEDWDNDGNFDHIFRDEDGDGNPESCEVLAKDGSTIQLWTDDWDDGTWDRYWFGYVGDTPHFFREDSDNDGKFDTVWVDGGRPGDASLYHVLDGRVGGSELYVLDPVEPVPAEPRPRLLLVIDCVDLECDAPPTPVTPPLWFEDLLPPGLPDGLPDHWFSDADDDGNPEYGAKDGDQDGRVDEAYLDRDDDGHWDFRWQDQDQDGTWDDYKRDTDGDGLYDRWWTDENLDQRVQADEIIVLDPPEPPSPEPAPLGPLGFCSGGPECPAIPLLLPDPEDHAHHDRSNLRLTVTDQGTLGFLSASGEEGGGLTYPSETSAENQLYIAGLWMTQGENRVLSRDYDADPKKSWIVATDPDGHVRRTYTGSSDHDIGTGITDEGDPDAFGLYIRQESWAFDSGSDNDDFIIVRYFIHNRSDSDLTDLRAGLFLDLDLGESSLDEEGGTEPDRKLAYLVDPGGLHLGARLLEGDVSAAENVTLIHNPTFVWPNEYILPADKLGFMRRTDPLHELPLSPAPDDYSLLLSAGPFDLAPAESTEVAFAIVGGTTLEDLRLHSDRAAAAHNPSTDVQDAVRLDPARIQLMVGPNPFQESTTISFHGPVTSPIHVTVHDAQGRRVRTLARGLRSDAGRKILWDGRSDSGREVESGVYFVRLVAGELRVHHRVVQVR